MGERYLVVRMLALGALNWSVEWYGTGRRTPSEIAAHAATMILDGVTAAPGLGRMEPGLPRPTRRGRGRRR